MTRTFLLVLVPLLLAPAAPADSGSGISLDDPCLVAWTAWYARETKDETLLPTLKAYLRRGVRSEAEEFAQMAVLDALVALEAKTTTDEILPALGSSLTQNAAVVLAVRWADDATRLAVFDRLDRYEAADDKPWLAMVNCAAERRIPGIALRLLNGFEVTVILFVTDRPDERNSFRPPAGGVPGDGWVTVPPGFPETAIYRLFVNESTLGFPLTGGRRPLRGYRCGGNGGGDRIGFGCVSGSIDRQDVRLEWMADLLGVEIAGLPIERYPCRNVGFPSEKVLLRRVEKVREEIAGMYRATGRRFVAAGLMAEEDLARIRPDLEFRVHDLRLRKDRPIPSLEPPAPKKPRRSGRRPALR